MNTINDIKEASLIAKAYFSDFESAHDTYNAITAAGNGKIYYVLCSESYEVGGQMYSYDPTTDQTQWIAEAEITSRLYRRLQIGYRVRRDCKSRRAPQHRCSGFAIPN
ncbi:hypothetical protein Runsl_1896 [Runella slithyformis DSM 19594]|uniref:Uncharacterized protein n=2 Tax=Runella TaxID=105 RepID=A0A7U3ZJG1_RUNSL|nr:hypothetical protein Runsl_1896 [Runella slithyformis DSM 19594]